MNIYTALIFLKKLSSHYSQNSDKKKFFDSLRLDIEAYLNVSVLDKTLETSPSSAKSLEQIKQIIQKEIDNTSIFYFIERSELLYLLNCLHYTKEHISNLRHGIDGEGQNIFYKLSEELQGELVLPVTQALDINLGATRGVCAGYTLAWLYDLINMRTPFGINPNNPQIRTMISHTSPNEKLYSELNHRAVLTERITKLQYHQSRIKEWSKKTRILLAHSSREISERLINMANKKSKNGLYLSLGNMTVGHAVGFKKEGAYYHFFDCNFGWFRFKSATDFSRWFDFYFSLHQKIDPISHYSIVTIQKQKKQNLFSWSNIKSNLKWSINSVVNTLINIVTLPFRLLNLFDMLYQSKKALATNTDVILNDSPSLMVDALIDAPLLNKQVNLKDSFDDTYQHRNHRPLLVKNKSPIKPLTEVSLPLKKMSQEEKNKNDEELINRLLVPRKI